MAPDEGWVRAQPLSAVVVHVAQELLICPGETVLGYLARSSGVAAREQAMNVAAQALADAESRAVGDAYDAALQDWLAAGGADFAERTAEVGDRLGLRVDVGNRNTERLSGGQSARLRLATALVSRPDVLLLDEPTNDLDLAGLSALESLVTSTPAGVVLVSHDREFLTRTATGVVEIDEFTRQSSAYTGDWQSYVNQRAAARLRAQDNYEQYADTRDGLAQRAHRQREWSRAGAARSGNPAREGDKHIRFREVQRAQPTGAKAAATEAVL